MKCILLLSFITFLVGCSGGGGGGGSSPPQTATTVPPTTTNVLVRWTANHEKAVNQAGGGYRLYYSNTSGFSIGSGTVVNVPYVSGASSPISVTLSSLAAGTYYMKIVAYSALNPPGGTTGSTSGTSSEYSISVP